MSRAKLKDTVSQYQTGRGQLVKVVDATCFIAALIGCISVGHTSWRRRPDRIHVIGLFVAVLCFHCISFIEEIVRPYFGEHYGDAWSTAKTLKLVYRCCRHHIQLSTLLLVIYNLRTLVKQHRELLVEMRLEDNVGKLLNHPKELLAQFFAAGIVSVVSFRLGSGSVILWGWVINQERNVTNPPKEEVISKLLSVVVCLEVLPMIFMLFTLFFAVIALRCLKTNESQDDVDAEKRRAAWVAMKVSIIYVACYLPVTLMTSRPVVLYRSDINPCDIVLSIIGNKSNPMVRFLAFLCGCPCMVVGLLFEKKHIRSIRMAIGRSSDPPAEPNDGEHELDRF